MTPLDGSSTWPHIQAASRKGGPTRERRVDLPSQKQNIDNEVTRVRRDRGEIHKAVGGDSAILVS